MLLKTKDGCGKLGEEAGMSMKKSYLAPYGGNVLEKKGCYPVGGRWELRAAQEGDQGRKHGLGMDGGKGGSASSKKSSGAGPPCD